MEKINIQNTTKQSVTAEEISSLANHILHRKGQVDFTGTNVSVQCSDSLPLGAAAIVQTCAHKQGATSFSISGASDLSDEIWNELVQDDSLWIMLDELGIPFNNFLTALAYDIDVVKSFDGTGRWLVGDGSAYLDTGIVPSGTEFSIKMKFLFTGTNSWMGLYGTYWTDNGISLLYGGNSTTPYFHTAGVSVTSGFTINTNCEYTVEHNYSNIILTPTGGTATAKVTGATALFSTSRNFLIFANANYNKALAKIANADITLNGTRHFFIPMTKDSVNGMYDLIGQKFYTNANTSGAFTIE